MTIRASRLLAALACGGAAALLLAAAFPTTTAAFSLTGEALGLDQRDTRVFNNFADASANDNAVPHPNFPGAVGAPLALWKAHAEWGSLPRAGDGLGDGLASNANLGDGGANFDNTWQGLAPDAGNTNANLHVASASLGGALLALTLTPTSDGWKIVYNEDVVWDDGPGQPVVGSVDLQGVATHEIGHVLGLGHSTASGATMATAIAGTGVGQRSLSADDSAGLQAVYGAASPSKPRIDALSGSTDTGRALVIHGANFAPAGNEAWFTSAVADGDPLIVAGLASTAGGTQIALTIPAGAVAGELLVRAAGGSGAALSNAFPIDVDAPPGSIALTEAPLAGNAGELPLLSAQGDLSPGGAGFTLLLQLIDPGAAGLLFVGTGEGNLPFKGGVFDPIPLLLQVPLVASAGGDLSLPAGIPADTPSGLLLVLQAWFVDAAAVQGVSGTTGLGLTTP